MIQEEFKKKITYWLALKEVLDNVNMRKIKGVHTYGHEVREK